VLAGIAIDGLVQLAALVSAQPAWMDNRGHRAGVDHLAAFEVNLTAAFNAHP
jgi:hypothetical protein